MRGARARVGRAHVDRPSPRRDAAALGLSFLIHALVFVLVALFWNSAPGGAPRETDVTADVILEEAAQAVQPPPPPAVRRRSRGPREERLVC